MELKLQKANHEYYETLRFAPFPCETMRENIVPDSCGDIARIVDTPGTVCLTGRELTGDGSVVYLAYHMFGGAGWDSGDGAIMTSTRSR